MRVIRIVLLLQVSRSVLRIRRTDPGADKSTRGRPDARTTATTDRSSESRPEPRAEKSTADSLSICLLA